MAELATTREQAEFDRTEAESKISALSSELESVRTACDVLREVNESLQRDRQDATEGDVSNAEKAYEELGVRHQELMDSTAALGVANSHLQGEIEALSAKCVELESTNAAMQDTNTELQKEYDDLSAQSLHGTSEAQTAYQALKEKYAQLEENNTHLGIENVDITQKHTDLDAAHVALQISLSKLQSASHQAQQESIEAKERHIGALEDLQSMYDELLIKHAGMKSAFLEERAAREGIEQGLSKAEAALKISKESISDLEKSSTELQQQLHATNAQGVSASLFAHS